MNPQSESVARTKIEFIYKEVLGDVAGLVERIEGVERRIGNVARNQPSAKPQASWARRWSVVVGAAALVALGAAVGAVVSRLMPIQTPQQVLDTTLADAIKHQIAREGPNSVLWSKLSPEAQQAAIAAMGH